MAEPAVSYSTRLLRKGALVEETYRILASWNLEESLSANLRRIRKTNSVGAKNESWLREVTTTMSSRFAAGDSLAPLALLAKAQYPLERWRYCLLWHMGSTDGLFIRFMEEFLFPHYEEGIAAFDTGAVLPFIESVEQGKLLDTSEQSRIAELKKSRDHSRVSGGIGSARAAHRIGAIGADGRFREGSFRHRRQPGCPLLCVLREPRSFCKSVQK